MAEGHPLGIRLMFPPDVFRASGVAMAFLLSLFVSLSDDRSLSGDPCSFYVAIVSLAKVCSRGGSACDIFLGHGFYYISSIFRVFVQLYLSIRLIGVMVQWQANSCD